MQIDAQKLYGLIGTSKLEAHGFPKQRFGSVVRIVRRFYCIPRTLASNCPRECQLCQVTIVTALERIDAQAAKTPEAVLTYLMREAVSRQLEQQQEIKAEAAQPRTVDEWGTRDNTNVFEALLTEMS